MLIDVFVIAVSYALAWLIRFQGIFEHSAVQSKTVQEYMFMLIFIIPGYVLLYQAFDLYTPMRMQGRRLVLAGIVKANALGLLIIMFALYNFKELDYSRLTLVSFCVINIVLEWFVRMVIFYILRDMRKRGMNWIIPVLHWFPSVLSILSWNGLYACLCFTFSGTCGRKE